MIQVRWKNDQKNTRWKRHKNNEIPVEETLVQENEKLSEERKKERGLGERCLKRKKTQRILQDR